MSWLARIPGVPRRRPERAGFQGESPAWLVLLDPLLGLCVLLFVITGQTVLFFHLVYVFLAVGAFYWGLRAFTVRLVLWVGITGLIMLFQVAAGATKADELSEVPLLGAIIVMVFLIARRRELALEALAKSAEQQRVLAARMRDMALQDALTGLPNRRAFVERIERATARASRHGSAVAVLFLDLDGFKVINDSLGHAAGDRLLTLVAERLRGLLRPEDTVARLGGDEFTILVEDVPNIGAVIHIAERINAALVPPVEVAGRTVSITTSVGIAITDPDNPRSGDLLRDADAAMYRAKAEGKSRYAIFESQMHAGALAQLELEADLRGAADRGELVLHYQPKVTLGHVDVSGVEALVRWRHPTRGLLFPGAFIPLAESSGLIVSIGRWVLSEACRQLRIWQDLYSSDPPLLMCVNLSALEFRQPDLIDHLSCVLHEFRLPAGSLMIELTENVLVMEEDLATVALGQLRSIGVQLAIDDFGTGHSSLAYLKRFPVDLIKIDRSFVAGLGHDPKDAGIIQVLVTFARNLGLKLVAEGVETEAQRAQLVAIGCELGQGYYFSRPQAADKLSELFAASEYLPGRGLRLSSPPAATAGQ